MYGLYRFKTGFGGEILHRPGSYDYALKFFAYRGYRIAERARTWYYKSFRKRGKRKAGEDSRA
jgi:lipid II:glycine glycyltransferase (peptidoglycan interpeptide bridge formation enzyme)